MIPTKDARPNGLHMKYQVFRADMSEPAPGEHFVLRLDEGGNDPIHTAACRKAVLTYAEEIAPHLPELAADLRARYGSNGECHDKQPEAGEIAHITSDDIRGVLDGIVAAGHAELRQMVAADLEAHWHFRWDETVPVPVNLYRFHRMLDLYGNFCRRWEEMHNGSACVVERVRDRYLMPKIRAFCENLTPRAPDADTPTEVTDGSVSLQHFVAQVRHDASAFERSWLMEHAAAPDKFPLVFPAENAGLWWEFLQGFVEGCQEAST
jgi:hypothetical protein